MIVVFNSGDKLVSVNWGFIRFSIVKIIQSRPTLQKLDNSMVVDVYVKCRFDSGIHGKLIMTIHL